MTEAPGGSGPLSTRCREKLRAAGLPYPKSNCEQCGSLIRPGWRCAEESQVPSSPPHLPSCVQPPGDFAGGQRDMQHRAALAVIRSAAGKGLTEEQRQLLADAAETILALEVANG